MIIQAQASNLRTSPRKLRLVADLVRPMGVDQALLTLKHLRKRAALPLLKVLKQARANGGKGEWQIKTLEVNAGPTYKRFQAVSKGRGHSIKKRTSHIKIVLEADGTKSKS